MFALLGKFLLLKMYNSGILYSSPSSQDKKNELSKLMDITIEILNCVNVSVALLLNVEIVYPVYFIQVKIALLRFMESLTELMDPGDFTNSSETRLAVSRVISWMKEAKNSEVRRVS